MAFLPWLRGHPMTARIWQNADVISLEFSYDAVRDVYLLWMELKWAPQWMPSWNIQNPCHNSFDIDCYPPYQPKDIPVPDMSGERDSRWKRLEVEEHWRVVPVRRVTWEVEGVEPPPRRMYKLR